MPYAFIPEKAVEAMPKLSGVATKVMVALATFMPGRRQEGCYPSLAAISERAGINREKTVTAAIKELVAAGILVRERRRRQTNLLKWATLEQANSAGTRVLEPAVSALSKTLEPAVSAQVYPAVSAPLRYPMKEPITTLSQNDEKPPRRSAPEMSSESTNQQGEKAPIPFPQGNQTTSPLPPSSVSRRKPAVAMGDAGFIVPDAIRQGWAAAYPGVDIDRETAKAFAWCQNNPRKAPKKEYGRFLNRWMGLATPFMTAAEQAVDDAELIRGAEDKYPDPDERAAFFWARKERGLRVPPGVDCRPMPVEKEVVA